MTLDGLFHLRARRSATSSAYRYFDEQRAEWRDLSWARMLSEAARWQAALRCEGLQAGDRVAIMLKNCPHWIAFDQAALGLGLVTVPLYTSDRPENVAHVLQDSGAKLLLIDSAQHWRPLREACAGCPDLRRVVVVKTLPESDDDARLRGIDEWLPQSAGAFSHRSDDPDRVATLIYTSGTTGKSKGVMLSHRNLLSNTWASLQTFEIYPEDIFLSFLPLSHALERMGGYLIPMMSGAEVAFSRSVQQLQEDLLHVQPTILITVPRIFERIEAAIRAKLAQGSALKRALFSLAVDIGYRQFEYTQGRAPWQARLLLWPGMKKLVASKITQRFGGRLRLAVSGGAALSASNAHTFIGLGITIIQGYGLTETSPVVSVNRVEDNLPATVGKALPEVEVRLGAQDALEVRGANVMLGYWNNTPASQALLTPDGWLNTGDVAHIDAQGRITITGRIKEIIVLNNGEKIPPQELEAAILADPLFEQAMVVGEGKPYLSLLAVVNRERWEEAARERGLPGEWPENLQLPQARAFALARVAQRIKTFPGYARIRRIALIEEPWSLENDLLTPTLKLKRNKVMEKFRGEYAKLYEGYLGD